MTDKLPPVDHSLEAVLADMDRWLGDRPDEWKMAEWMRDIKLAAKESLDEVIREATKDYFETGMSITRIAPAEYRKEFPIPAPAHFRAPSTPGIITFGDDHSKSVTQVPATVRPGAGATTDYQPAVTDPTPAATPFPDCKFAHCDLPGQCIAEGKCHHPKGREYELERENAELKQRVDEIPGLVLRAAVAQAQLAKVRDDMVPKVRDLLMQFDSLMAERDPLKAKP